MVGKYQAYPEYKPAHLGWLNQIPTHWGVKRLKYLGEAIIGLTYSPDEVVDEGEGILVLRSSNVQDKKLTFDDNVFVNKKVPQKLIAQKGDILICARNGSRALIGKNAQIDECAVAMTFGAFMSIFRSPYNDYLSKVFNSPLFEYQSGSFLTATINQLTTGNLNSFEVPLPPETERKQIVSFLDHETAKIDVLIEKQQQLIQLLKEKRQAVISHAVTKGLNPNAPMRDSGVKWLGDVPEHWCTIPLKYVAKIKYGIGEPPEYQENGTPLIRATNIRSGKVSAENLVLVNPVDIPISRIVWLKRGDIIVVRSGAGTGDSSIIPKEYEGSIAGFDMVVTPEKCLSTFLGYALLSNYIRNDQIDLEKTRAAQPHLNAEELGDCFVLIPPMVEQIEIVEHIERKLTKFDLLVQKAEEAVVIINERRTALISAAVSGKIDVRHRKEPLNKANMETMETTL
ncbi:restriction endonuclease subunit S [Methylobacter sp. BBA5.1]|uniref:restriction endonuclease subunit S n=1 Tax=Methylobacter sp. BBA5.1 TaxID=1495064 RepID=UPI00068A1183|nr:restriction endonuclease subunit S [Methylobacter sp. BBA5.1]